MVPLSDAVRQWANMGALVDGLHRGDFAVISRALEDTIAEPRRASLVPGLAVIKRAAVEAGALGCSLSGSGPSLFALCEGAGKAATVAVADDRRGESPNRRRAADLCFQSRCRAPARARVVGSATRRGRSPQKHAGASVRTPRSVRSALERSAMLSRGSRRGAVCTFPKRSTSGRRARSSGSRRGR